VRALPLNTIAAGSPSDLPPLLIVHGLFGSGRNWGAIAKRLGQTRQVIAVDMRNHAGSPWADSHGYDDLAADLAGVIAAHGGRMDVLGHSMGGKAAMALALTQPALVNRLLVADIAPVAYTHSQNHLIAAMRALPLDQITTRTEADAALAPRITDDATRAFLLQSLDLRSAPARWLLNLDVLEREMTHITGWPEISGRFNGPTLFLSGGRSDYVLPDHRAPIKALFPAARFAKLPDAGHWLHAESPRAFIDTALSWFD
jgi:pimeloyl-ACP methyl ester carboxylesterase